MLRFPVATLIRFCHNHGLLQVENRPAWRTVAGGSRHYVDAIVKQLSDARTSATVTAIQRSDEGVRVSSERGTETFDAVVMACHAPQTLRLLGHDATPQERAVLGDLRTQPNTAVLHTDTSVMPQARRAWAAWNFERAEPERAAQADAQQVCLHYWINQLQPLPFAQNVIVSLNPLKEPDPAKVHGRFEWDHPVFDARAIAAQGELAQLQGHSRTWFCGAWCGFGFHEDGLRSGIQAAQGVMQALGHATADGAMPTPADQLRAA
jgi:predicted NAD/FAD-binding protein